MKSILLSSLLALFAFGFTNSTETVTNHTTKNLGTIRLNYNGGYTDLSIPGQGSYDAQVGASVSSVTINGQTITSPTTGTISLQNGALIDVQWSSSVTIEVVDHTEVLSPAP